MSSAADEGQPVRHPRTGSQPTPSCPQSRCSLLFLSDVWSLHQDAPNCCLVSMFLGWLCGSSVSFLNCRKKNLHAAVQLKLVLFENHCVITYITYTIHYVIMVLIYPSIRTVQSSGGKIHSQGLDGLGQQWF